jgi:hypothetical protein
MKLRNSYHPKKPHRLPLASMTYSRFDPATVSEARQDHAQGRDNSIKTGLTVKEKPSLNQRIMNMLNAIGGRANRAKKEMRRTAGQRGS